MALTKDDINAIMDGIPEASKTILIDKDEDGSVILDMGDFLTVFANAVLAYNKPSDFNAMKKEIE